MGVDELFEEELVLGEELLAREEELKGSPDVELEALAVGLEVGVLV